MILSGQVATNALVHFHACADSTTFSPGWGAMCKPTSFSGAECKKSIRFWASYGDRSLRRPFAGVTANSLGSFVLDCMPVRVFCAFDEGPGTDIVALFGLLVKISSIQF